MDTGELFPHRTQNVSATDENSVAFNPIISSIRCVQIGNLRIQGLAKLIKLESKQEWSVCIFWHRKRGCEPWPRIRPRPEGKGHWYLLPLLNRARRHMRLVHRKQGKEPAAQYWMVFRKTPVMSSGYRSDNSANGSNIRLKFNVESIICCGFNVFLFLAWYFGEVYSVRI